MDYVASIKFRNRSSSEGGSYGGTVPTTWPFIRGDMNIKLQDLAEQLGLPQSVLQELARDHDPRSTEDQAFEIVVTNEDGTTEVFEI